MVSGSLCLTSYVIYIKAEYYISLVIIGKRPLRGIVTKRECLKEVLRGSMAGRWGNWEGLWVS